MFNAVQGRPVTIRASVYLALFGHPRHAAAAMHGDPVNVIDGLQCYRDRFSVVYCRSSFRWPRELVYAQMADDILNPINTLISYSPFPAGLSLDPIEQHWASGPPPAAEKVTIVVKEPLAYVRRDFETVAVLTVPPPVVRRPPPPSR